MGFRCGGGNAEINNEWRFDDNVDHLGGELASMKVLLLGE